MAQEINNNQVIIHIKDDNGDEYGIIVNAKSIDDIDTYLKRTRNTVIKLVNEGKFKYNQ